MAFCLCGSGSNIETKFRNAKYCNLPLLGSSHLNEAQKVDLEAAEFRRELILSHHSCEAYYSARLLRFSRHA